MKKQELSLEFKNQLKKSISEFEEKIKMTPTHGELSWKFEQRVKESNAEFQEKLKKARANLKCILQYVEYEAETLIKEIDHQDSILKKWWKKWLTKGRRHKELAQVKQVLQEQAEKELMRKVMQQHAEQERMIKVIQQQVEQELKQLNLPSNSPRSYHFNYRSSFFRSFA